MRRFYVYLAISLFFFASSISLTYCFVWFTKNVKTSMPTNPSINPPLLVSSNSVKTKPVDDQQAFSSQFCGESSWQSSDYTGPQKNWHDQVAMVRSTIYGLNNIKVESDEPRIPSCAKPLLTKLKHELRDLIGLTLNDYKETDDPKRLQKLVIDRLKKGGIRINSDVDDVWAEDIANILFPYGDIEDIEIKHPNNHPELLAVTTTISIGSTTDTSFYIYKTAKEHKELAFNFEAQNYDQMDKAHLELSYRFSPSGKNGDFFLFIADIKPWFVSCWHSIRFCVFKFEDNLFEHKEIYSGAHEIYLCGEPPAYKMLLTKKGFTLKFSGDYKDSKDPYKAVKLSFKVNGNSVTIFKENKPVKPHVRNKNSY
ncbi:MAG: hypothetical protein FD167_1092 [bacterium]|nr:MAG: hypothetical protein FD167_1092 [bacterium]